LVAPRGEARSDLRIIFDLAVALGLGEHFFGGDIEAAWRHQLAPSGVGLDQLRAAPEGIRLPLRTVHRKYEQRGFRTPSGVVELYSETLREHGYPPLPTYDEPSLSPFSRPDLAARYPLILTCAKSLFFCETQHRGITSLRKSAPEPHVELHPDTAAARGIGAGDWVRLETPKGSIRARAKFNVNLDPGVVCGQHGWWQPAPELGRPGYPAFGEGSANLNLVLSQGPSDPTSGSSPLRASLCEVVRDDG
jgi:anaerobic selenocysteine-containing dehydrogenase